MTQLCFELTAFCSADERSTFTLPAVGNWNQINFFLKVHKILFYLSFQPVRRGKKKEEKVTIR